MAIGVGTGGSRGGGAAPAIFGEGGGNMALPPEYLAPSMENSPQIPWFMPKFCSKSDSFRVAPPPNLADLPTPMNGNYVGS